MHYTFIMEFRGGTYISQAKSKSLPGAYKKWVNGIDVGEIKFFNDRTRKKLLLGVTDKEDRPAKLEGLTNVFYQGVILGKYSAHIQIVVTRE